MLISWLHRAVHCAGAASLLACHFIGHTAHAESDVARSAYVAIGGTLDEDGSTTANVELGLPFGQFAWVYAGAGRDEAQNDIEDLNADTLSAGFGLGGRSIEFNVGYDRRKDGSAFEQDDWMISLDWRGARGGIGADVFVRSADAETVASIQRRRRAPLSGRIVESLDGEGYGLHGDFDVTDQLNLFASAMTYDYDAVDTNHPLLSRLLFLSGSGVTRDQAFLDHSIGVGAAYWFTNTVLTVQCFRDEVLETKDVTNTGLLSLTVLLGEHWSITPSLGYSDGENGEAGFGGLTVSYDW
jgi:hypothetical protein